MQTILDKVWNAGLYGFHTPPMCFALKEAHQQQVITSQEYNQASKEIQKYLIELGGRPIGTLKDALYRVFLPCSDSDVGKIYRDWDERPRKGRTEEDFIRELYLDLNHYYWVNELNMWLHVGVISPSEHDRIRRKFKGEYLILREGEPMQYVVEYEDKLKAAIHCNNLPEINRIKAILKVLREQLK